MKRTPASCGPGGGWGCSRGVHMCVRVRGKAVGGVRMAEKKIESDRNDGNTGAAGATALMKLERLIRAAGSGVRLPVGVLPPLVELGQTVSFKIWIFNLRPLPLVDYIAQFDFQATPNL